MVILWGKAEKLTVNWQGRHEEIPEARLPIPGLLCRRSVPVEIVCRERASSDGAKTLVARGPGRRN
jgi:hypothetical protein